MWKSINLPYPKNPILLDIVPAIPFLYTTPSTWALYYPLCASPRNSAVADLSVILAVLILLHFLSRPLMCLLERVPMRSHRSNVPGRMQRRRRPMTWGRTKPNSWLPIRPAQYVSEIVQTGFFYVWSFRGSMDLTLDYLTAVAFENSCP